METWNYKDYRDYLVKLEKNYGNFLSAVPLRDQEYMLVIKLAFFNVRAHLDVYRDWDYIFGSGARANPKFLKSDDYLMHLVIPSTRLFWHYKWLVRNSKTFYYNYQRFDEFLLLFEFCNFIEASLQQPIIKISSKTLFLSSDEIGDLEHDLTWVSQTATSVGQRLYNEFPIVEEFENKEFRFYNDEDTLTWGFETYAFRSRDLLQSLHFDFKACRNIPIDYYKDLMLSFRIAMKSLYEEDHVFENFQDLFFIAQYYITSTTSPLLAAVQIRYSYYYFVEKSRETIFKDLFIYWFGRPVNKNSKYAHIFYMVRHKEKQFMYYVALVINFTDKNFENSNINLDYNSKELQQEFEDRLILEHYTLTVDTSHFNDELKIPQLANLNLKKNYSSSNLSDEEFEKKFLFKYYTKDKIVFESSEFLDWPAKNETTQIHGKFYGKPFAEIKLPGIFDDNDTRFLETLRKPTYFELKILPSQNSDDEQFKA
jgi:hypothetical protein